MGHIGSLVAGNQQGPQDSIEPLEASLDGVKCLPPWASPMYQWRHWHLYCDWLDCSVLGHMTFVLLRHWPGGPGRLQCHLLACVCTKHLS